MKCDFTSDGTLEVIPGNAVEQFALSKWDQTKIRIIEKDWMVSLNSSFKDLTELIEQRKADYKEYLRHLDEKKPPDSAGASDVAD